MSMARAARRMRRMRSLPVKVAGEFTSTAKPSGLPFGLFTPHAVAG
jgi:hypothetical protein